MRRVLLLILKIMRMPKIWYKRKMFLENAELEDESSIQFGINAYCFNKTGKRESIHIGHHCEILARISASSPTAKINIGNYTTIRDQSLVGGGDRITIGNHVIISNHVTIYDNNNHPTDPETRKKMCESGFYSDMWNWIHSAHKPVVIEDNVWIGEYATILKGVIVGKGAIVASHSVVTKDVEPYTVVAGNPAKKVKELNRPS